METTIKNVYMTLWNDDQMAFVGRVDSDSRRENLQAAHQLAAAEMLSKGDYRVVSGVVDSEESYIIRLTD